MEVTVYTRPPFETPPLGRGDGKSAPGVHEMSATATGSYIEPPSRRPSGICGGCGAARRWPGRCGDHPDVWGRGPNPGLYAYCHTSWSLCGLASASRILLGLDSFFSKKNYFMVPGIGRDGGRNSLCRYACTGAPAETRLARDLRGRFTRHGSE